MVAKLLNDNNKELKQRSNDDGDDNKNGKKSIKVYISKTTTFERAPRFLYIT